MFSDNHYFTLLSQQKQVELPIFIKDLQIPHAFEQQLHKFIKASTNMPNFTEVKITEQLLSLSDIKQKLKNFDQITNQNLISKFQDDIEKMNKIIIIKLYGIHVYFIWDTNTIGNYHKYIAFIMHSIQTFIDAFEFQNKKKQLNHLKIFISLDQNERVISSNNIEECKKNSTGFNVSGMSNSATGEIIITRIEEITKLLYHELIHYFKFDGFLRNSNVSCNWSIMEDHLVIYEAYTEFLAVILNSMYQCIQYSSITNINYWNSFRQWITNELNYSFQLTARILHFYNYDHKTLMNFFSGIGKKNQQPIYLWEYIIARTIMFHQINQIFSTNHSIKNSGNNIINVPINHIISPPKEIIDLLAQFLKVEEQNELVGSSISYVLYDLDIQKI